MATYFERESPLWQHIAELVVRLRRILFAMAIAAAVLSLIPVGVVKAIATGSIKPLMQGPTSYVPLVSALPRMIIEIVVPKKISLFGRTYNITIMPTSPMESFDVLFYTVLLLGVLGASPVIAHEIWAYIKPALYPHEVKFIKKAVAIGFICFIVGAYMGLFMIAPWFMRIMLYMYPYFIPTGYAAILRVSVTDALKLGVLMAIAMGLVLEIPPIIYYLLAFRIIDPDIFTGEGMKWAFVASLLVGAVISPDPTGMGMIAIAVTLYVPFYVAVKLGTKAYYKRKEMEEKGLVLAREEVAVIKELATAVASEAK